MKGSNRRQRRAVSRAEARRTARPNPTPGPNRAQRRTLQYRPSAEITYHRNQQAAARRRALDTALRRSWAEAGRAGLHPSGQKRINHKRAQRSEFWNDWVARKLTEPDQGLEAA